MLKFLRFGSVVIASAFLCATPMSFSTALSSAHASPNIDVYAQLPRTASVRVSPDGKHIAMLAPYRGDKAVFVYNLDNPNANTIIMLPPKDSIVKAVDWASNKHIITLARIRGKGEGKMKRFSTLYSRWLSYNIETQKSVILLDDRIKEKSYRVQYGGGLIHGLPNDADHVLMAMGEYGLKPEQRQYRVNLDTGKERLERRLSIKSGNIAYSIDGERVLAREEYDDRSGKYQVFFGEGEKEKRIYERRFNTDKNRTEYFFTVHNGKLIMQETDSTNLLCGTLQNLA